MPGAVAPGVICTRSGIRFDVTNPQDADIIPEDIAWGLAHKIRFGGHTSEPYTVAQHCIHVADLCRGEPIMTQLAALLHDAAEAYMTDLPSPIKAICPAYATLEKDLQGKIFQKFGLPKGWALSMPDAIKLADETSYHLERGHLMPQVDWWPTAHEPTCGFDLYTFKPETAYSVWLDRFYKLEELRRTPHKEGDGD